MPILDLNNTYDVKRYESFIEKSDYGHFMQSINWSKVKSNWEKDYVYLEDEKGNIKAALSILSIKNDGVNSFMYAPRGPVCNLENIEDLKALIKEAYPVVKKRSGFLLRIDPEYDYNLEMVEKIKNSNIKNLNLRTIGEDEHSFSNPRVNMMVDLRGKSFEDYIASFNSKQRNTINKSYRSGLVTKRYSKTNNDFEKELDIFYKLTQIMAKRQNITHRPKEYFKRLFESFDDVVLYQVGDDEEVLASCIVLGYNKKSFYAYSASSNSKRNLNPSNQLNIEAIKDAIKKNRSEYDMGGIFSTEKNNGLYKFKRFFCKEEGLRAYIGEIDIVFDQDLYNKFLN